jgi:signal transduction histidine kinase
MCRDTAPTMIDGSSDPLPACGDQGPSRSSEAETALRNRTAQLEAVRQLTTEIVGELDFERLLDSITRRAAELVHADRAVLFLLDGETGRLVPRGIRGFARQAAHQAFSLGQGVTGTVAHLRTGLVVNDYAESPLAVPFFLHQMPVGAVLGEPLLYRERLLGVVTLAHSQAGQTFSADDQQLVRLFAGQAAIACENALLYEELARHAADLEQRVQERTAALDEVNQKLQAASRHKSEFLANMSHELRTPLNSILGFAQLLLEQAQGALSTKQLRYLTHIHDSGQHLLQLINDILDISKVEAGKFVLQPERLSLGELLDDILVIARGLAHQKGQSLTLEIDPDLPPIQADPVRVKQILFNLLSNAVKFTPRGGRVAVEARGSGAQDQVEIAVRDTGIGIRGEDLGRLFQEFVQLETTQAQHHEGSGLGLALTKRLVELHGGRIQVASAGEGQGTTFTIQLPAASPSADTREGA